MFIGRLLIYLSFAIAIVAAVGYALYYKRQKLSYLNVANHSYYALFGVILLTSALLLSQILAHNFKLSYVYSYSSKDLPLFYLISSFWAGQEGTLLLWLLLSTLFGFLLIRKHAQKNPLVLFYILLVNAYLLLILIKKNPFAVVWEVRGDVVHGTIPRDGVGLNPLLQNPWMVVHPPALFFGYASTVVPFALALSAMARKRFQEWVGEALPWIVFNVLSLGAGIMLGAYWAYITLGWGGYWGWDPVENSSLIPWLFSLALLHSAVIQFKRKGLIRTNLFLAGLTFLTMLWGSFLARSEVLTNFSVHAFGGAGLNVILMAFVVIFAGIFLYLYFRSERDIKSPKLTEEIFSRETITLIGILIVLLSAVFTFVGTASPIFTGLMGKPSSVSADFYNNIHKPLAILLLAALAIAPLLAWKVSEFRNLPTLFRSVIVAAVVTVAGVLLGLTKPLSIMLVFLSVLVILVNASVFFRLVRKKTNHVGAQIAHVGVGLMMIGIVTSSMYDVSDKVTLPRGEFHKSEFGYQLKFVGFREMPNGKDRVKLKIKRVDQEFTAEAVFYFSSYTNSYMVSPYVKLDPMKDIYISPIRYIPSKQKNVENVRIQKGETKTVKGFTITFHDFGMGDHTNMRQMMMSAHLSVKAEINSQEKTYELNPTYILEGGEFYSPEVQIPDHDTNIKIAGINADQGMINLQLISEVEEDAVTADILGVEISEKPLINLLWLGTLVVIAGIFVSLLHRGRVQS